MTNWKELFEQDNTVFHCETEEHANELLKIAHELGYKWGNSYSFLDINFWVDYKENTCYKINTGKYCSKRFYNEYGYKIFNVNELFDHRTPFKLKRK